MRNGPALFAKDPTIRPPTLEHGGDIRAGRRKIARPMSTKLPLHIVLRSSRAKRQWSMLRPAFAGRIEQKARRLARTFDVRIYRYANAGNHVHVLARARSRPAFRSFLRAFAGVTARIVTGARRGKPIDKFWDRLAYSRVVWWGRDYRSVAAYVRQNEDEALGRRPYTPRRGAALRGPPPPPRWVTPWGRHSSFRAAPRRAARVMAAATP